MVALSRQEEDDLIREIMEGQRNGALREIVDVKKEETPVAADPAQGLKVGRLYHKDSGGIYTLHLLTNLNACKPGWDIQAVYHPVDRPTEMWSKPIDYFLNRFTLLEA